MRFAEGEIHRSLGQRPRNPQECFMNAESFQHADPFRKRRFINWFPMGLTYALLYMGRYNLTVSKNALGELMTKEDFGIIGFLLVRRIWDAIPTGKKKGH